MGSKETKSFEKFKHELKMFFRVSKTTPGQNIHKNRDEPILTSEIESRINSDASVELRLKTLKDLNEVILNSRLEENAIEKLCACTDDLLKPHISKEYRHTVFSFYQCLVQGQYDRLGSMRTHFFRVIKTSENREDNIPRLELFQKLTENGKVILSFEEEVGPFLLNWMPVIVAHGKSLEFLNILVNYIKYNAAYIDEDIISGIVQNTSYLCCQSEADSVVKGSLEVLDTIVCYSNISQQTMSIFVSALSRTVCLEPYNAASWRIMRNLLGTHMGHFCLHTLCKMLQEENSYSDTGLVCGIIFNLNMALLANKPDFVISYVPSYILPSISRAALHKDPIIVTEVWLCLKWLIDKYGEELKDPSWDRILQILEVLITDLEKHDERIAQCYVYLQDLFNKVNILLENNQFRGDIEILYQFIHKWYSLMPESLIFRLINYSTKFIVPVDVKWSEKLQCLLVSFFVRETRTDVRTRVLSVFVEILLQNRYYHEEDIINNIISPYFGNIATEKDAVVRKAAIHNLIQFCRICKTSYMESILDILEKVLKLPFEEDIVKSENDCTDVKLVLKGLLENFVLSIHQLPTSNAIKILSLLVSFLENHYKKPQIFESVIEIRWMVIDCLLKLRSDSKYRLGYCDDSANLKYSPYLIVDYRRVSNVSLSALSSVDSRSSASSSFEEDFVPNEITYISLSNACRVVVTALNCELDWRLLLPILQGIPTALKNKALILSRYPSDVEPLIKALISMIKDGYLPDALRNTPSKFTKPDFYSHVIPVLSAFASYHTHLESSLQQRLISCLQHGLNNKSAPQCVTALTTCLLEMRDAMVKLLPEVLLTLTKISTTVHVAIPTLEFLSMLSTFPKVFANFNSSQQLSIFAIILPYCNTFHYNPYVVSLAHHVIAVWFLKCRKSFRQQSVKYIISVLTNNLNNSDNTRIIKNDHLNEDSSNRKRSSSLTEQSNRRKDKILNNSHRLLPRISSDPNETKKEEILTFHRELTETCIDLMSRVAFTNCSALPKRLPSSDFVLHNGQTMTWLLGTKLIRITTSGCTQKPIRNGFCDKCYSSCILDKDSINFGSSSEESTWDIEKERLDHDNVQINEKNSSENASMQNLYHSSTPLCPTTSASFNAEDKKTTDILDTNEIEAQDQCVCWCQGWAEIHIRRPTGDISWIMRIQNDTDSVNNSDPMIDMSTLSFPSLIQEGISLQESKEFLNSSFRHAEVVASDICPSDSESGIGPTSGNFSNPNIVSSEAVQIPVSLECDCQADVNADSVLDERLNYQCHSRNPVRRSNSSPEMSSNWKYLNNVNSRSFNSSPVNEIEQNLSADFSCQSVECRKSVKCYAKDLRGNCEAIPEEFSGPGTTPPKNESIQPEEICSSTSLSCTNSTSNERSPGLELTPSISSFSFEEVTLQSDEKKLGNKFFDKQILPNDHFEFNRSASVSQVVPSSRKSPSVASHMNLSHNLASSQPHLTTKPPLSPPTYSTRALNRHLRDESRSDSLSQLNNTDYKRYRFYTISVMSPSKKPLVEWELPKSKISRNTEPKKSGLNPSFVFVQLYDSSQFGCSSETPLLVPPTTNMQRAINVFDRIPPYETHKVGVIYVGPGQANNESEILGNAHGSTRYAEFLSKLGTLVNLAEVNSQNVFLGGLEQSGNDGKFAYVWKDDVMQVIFHVATLMPNKETDSNCNNKKKHIGNDNVTIVYNESREEYDLNTLKGQFNFACVIVEPLDHGSNQVTVKAKPELKKIIGPNEKKIVSDKNVSLLARQLALHINLASTILFSPYNDKTYGSIHASNWLVRLRKIKHIKSKILDAQKSSSNSVDNNCCKIPYERKFTCDFTEYTA